MNLSFVKEYYPDLEELTSSAMTSARDEVVRLLQASLPDVDLSPGTPTGDLIVTVLGAYRAAAEEANSRLMSDLDLENVANGIIYSCDFVRAYLGNFAVYDVENLRSSGLVRLTYSTPDARKIPLTARFKFGTSDAYNVYLADSSSAGINVLAAGSPHNGEVDTFALSRTSSSTWAVDVPLTGVLTDPVVRGTSGTTTIKDATLVGISSAALFSSGIATASLSELAKVARKMSYSMTAGSRASIKSMVLRNWPETAMVSPVVTGDREMLRSPAASAMIMQRPSVDVYLRSARDMQREAQIVRLEYVTDASGARLFKGHISLLHNPSRVVSVKWAGETAAPTVDSFTLYTRSTNSNLHSNQHCGSRYEGLSLEVVPVIDGTTTLIPRSSETVDGVYKQFAFFTVVYDADPLLGVVSSALESGDNVPPGVSVLVKSGPLVLLSSLDISFVKKPGTKTTLQAAREDIVRYFKEAGYPDTFRQTAIHDIMRNSGAERILNIGCYGDVRVSAASHRFLPDLYIGTPNLVDDWGGTAMALPSIPVTNVSEIVPSRIFNDNSGGYSNLWAATERTIRYAIDPENINFTELQ
jgi:hypothetical protein